MNSITDLLDIATIPFKEEAFTVLLSGKAFRLERIVSDGHTTPEGSWYDQEDHEWVMVLQGYGVLGYEDGTEVTLGPGEAIILPAHTRHCVRATSPEEPTIWLALHYR